MTQDAALVPAPCGINTLGIKENPVHPTNNHIVYRQIRPDTAAPQSLFKAPSSSLYRLVNNGCDRLVRCTGSTLKAAANLLGKEAHALLSVYQFVRLAQQRIEGL